MHTRASSIRKMAAAAAVVLAASTGACGGSSHSPRRIASRWRPAAATSSAPGPSSVPARTYAALNDQLADSCPGAAFNAFGVSLTGTFTFNADSSYTATNWREDFVVTQTLPLMCTGATSCTEGNGTESQHDGRIDR